MTPQELRHLEESLGIALPAEYNAVFESFPIPAYVGNSDIAVWDDAARLLKLNQEYRRGAPGGLTPWPAHLYAMGHAGDGCPYAIDLRDRSVWWIDHGSVDNPASQQEAPALGPWLADYFKVLREEMAGDGVSPDASPASRQKSESRGAWWDAVGCLFMLVLLFLFFAVIQLGMKWLLR